MSKQTKLSQSTKDLWISLVAAIKSNYRLSPEIVATTALLSGIIVVLSLAYGTFMTGCITTIVCLISIFLFFTTRNYGEAGVALAAGLLAAFAVEWTTGTFIAFATAMIGTTLIIVLISSLTLAVSDEDILRDAAMTLDEENYQEIEKQLKEISEQTPKGKLGPIEKAKAISLFCRSRIPLEAMKPALEGADTLSLLMRIESEEAALLVTGIYRLFAPQPSRVSSHIDSLYYGFYQKTNTTGKEFVEGFKQSQWIALSGTLSPEIYMLSLTIALDYRVPTEFISNYILQTNQPTLQSSEADNQ